MGNQRGRGQRHCLRLAFRFLPLCKLHGNIFCAGQAASSAQLGHHQSFCLKEYIAIKSRKYAFTLAIVSSLLAALLTLSLIRFPTSFYCSHYSHFPFALFMRHNTWPWRNAHCIWAEAAAAEAGKTFGLLSLVALDVLLPQQIKIASFCASHALLCPHRAEAGAGARFNARHLINCPADGKASMKGLSRSWSWS